MTKLIENITSGVLMMSINSRENDILVLGGTGHYGRHIVQALIDSGEEVTVLSRNAKKAQTLLGNQVRIIEGDITSEETIKEALKSVKAIIISLSAFTRKLIRKQKLIERDSVLRLLEEAKKAKISRVVYISVFERPVKDIKLLQGKIKREIEIFLDESEFNTTILGAAPSLEIFFAMIRGGKMIVPGGGPPALPTVSATDLGKIAAQAVLRTDLDKQRFRMVGPEAISFDEAAERISKVTGEPLRLVKPPLIIFRTGAFLTGLLSLIFPYISQMLSFILLLNQFDPEFSTRVPKDHQLLQDIFDYEPVTLEKQAKIWYDSKLSREVT